MDRFESKRVVGIMDEFMHIRQKGSVDEYRAIFSDMKVLGEPLV